MPINRTTTNPKLKPEPALSPKFQKTLHSKYALKGLYFSMVHLDTTNLKKSHFCCKKQDTIAPKTKKNKTSRNIRTQNK